MLLFPVWAQGTTYKGAHSLISRLPHLLACRASGQLKEDNRIPYLSRKVAIGGEENDWR